MLRMSCRDLGSKDCDYTATGETAGEVKTRLLEHAQRDHEDVYNAMTPEQHAQANRRMDEYLGSDEARV